MGRVTDLIEQKITEKDSENTEVYLCGDQKMIEAYKQILKEKKFPDKHSSWKFPLEIYSIMIFWV